MTAGDDELDVAELADLCESLIAAWHHDSAQSAGGAAPDAQAAIDVASIHEAFPEGVPANTEYAHGQMAGQMVDGIVLLLQSVVTLLRAEPLILLGVWPLVRAELEYAGRVAWLLEPLPEENAGTRRMARALLEHLSSLQRQRYTAGKWDNARARQFKQKRDELQKRIGGLFDDVHTPMDDPAQIGQWEIGGETMMPLGQATRLFLTQNFTNSAALYDILSDSSHPSVISLALQSTTVDLDGVTIWSYPVIPRVVDFQTRLACLILYKAALTVLDYFGFPAGALGSWASEAPAHWFQSGAV